ncbi:helix-turn-helix domain-containing protein [Pseudobythopirellula maris]|uniref:helix-turn-helix domain-containing protein n=1 Tax=Pseudobythopirellula maris TaxID=2527991 RepID=UPI0011B5A8DF|nr:helix-turn-helix transcriptional regulator [Pseudobythopirellula maris]
MATNLRLLMAQRGIRYEDVIDATGLDARTVRGIVNGSKRPHARTLSRLAEGLGVSVERLFHSPNRVTAEGFDSHTNSAIQGVIDANPELFAGWGEEDFGELCSRFGCGGAMTQTGVLQAAEAMNRHRAVLSQARVVLESDQADLLTEVVKAFYDRVTLDK